MAGRHSFAELRSRMTEAARQEPEAEARRLDEVMGGELEIVARFSRPEGPDSQFGDLSETGPR